MDPRTSSERSPSARPRVSLLMPVHDRAALLDTVLERLAETTTYENVELVAVDDHSTDGSDEILRRWLHSGRIGDMTVLASDGRGAIAALNTALRAATGEVCVQLDDDVTIETSGWVERMLDVLLLDERVGVVTCKVVFDSGQLHACGVNLVGEWGWHERTTTPAEPLGRRQWINRVHQRPLEGAGGEAEARMAEVDAGIGCCMMYWRDEALGAGGYDPVWSPVWFDDVDLCLKIRARGRKVFYTPEVRVVHHFRARRGPRRTMRQRLRPAHLVGSLIRRVGTALPRILRTAIEKRVDIDLFGHFTREQCALLRHHHAVWRERWGFDARNPDMVEIRRRYGDTEICWASDPDRRAAGERIAEAFEARRLSTRVPAG